MNSKFKRFNSKTRQDWTTWTQNRGMITRNWKKKTKCWSRTLMPPETSLKKSTTDSAMQRCVFAKTLWSRELSIWKKSELCLSKRRRTSSSRPTIWICLFPKRENAFKTASKKTTLFWSKWTKNCWTCPKQFSNTSKTSRKLTTTLETGVINQAKNKNLRSYTKRKKKSTNLLRSLSSRKVNTKEKSKRINNWLLSCLSICRKLWRDKTNCLLLNKLMRWKMTWNSSKDSLKIPRQLLQDFASKKSRSIMTSRKSRT